MPVQWIHWIQWTIGHTPFAISQACYLHGVDVNPWRHSSYLPHNLFTAQPNVHWTYACPLDPMDKIKCPLDIYMSIGSNGQVKCPFDICMSNGSIGSNGPLDILPLPSHRPAYLHGVDATYNVIRNDLFTAQSNVQLDIFLSIGSNGQIKCPVDMCLSIGSNG